MPSAKETLDRQFLEMRGRLLSLAADLDRIERAPGGHDVTTSDIRLKNLREAITILLTPGTTRAEKVQTLFSDKT
jgi:hypothetical protein